MPAQQGAAVGVEPFAAGLHGIVDAVVHEAVDQVTQLAGQLGAIGCCRCAPGGIVGEEAVVAEGIAHLQHAAQGVEPLARDLVVGLLGGGLCVVGAEVAQRCVSTALPKVSRRL